MTEENLPTKSWLEMAKRAEAVFTAMNALLKELARMEMVDAVSCIAAIRLLEEKTFRLAEERGGSREAISKQADDLRNGFHFSLKGGVH